MAYFIFQSRNTQITDLDFIEMKLVCQMERMVIAAPNTKTKINLCKMEVFNTYKEIKQTIIFMPPWKKPNHVISLIYWSLIQQWNLLNVDSGIFFKTMNSTDNIRIALWKKWNSLKFKGKWNFKGNHFFFFKWYQSYQYYKTKENVSVYHDLELLTGWNIWFDRMKYRMRAFMSWQWHSEPGIAKVRLGKRLCAPHSTFLTTYGLMSQFVSNTCL